MRGRIDLIPTPGAHASLNEPHICQIFGTPTRSEGSGDRLKSNTPIDLSNKKRKGVVGKHKKASANMNAQQLTAAETRIHALINPVSGIGREYLREGHSDDENIRDKMHGVSFAVHRGFETRGDSFEYFQQHYPHIKREEYITEMNNNASLKAFNLNNPSPLLCNSLLGIKTHIRRR